MQLACCTFTEVLGPHWLQLIRRSHSSLCDRFRRATWLPTCWHACPQVLRLPKPVDACLASQGLTSSRRPWRARVRQCRSSSCKLRRRHGSDSAQHSRRAARTGGSLTGAAQHRGAVPRGCQHGRLPGLKQSTLASRDACGAWARSCYCTAAGRLLCISSTSGARVPDSVTRRQMVAVKCL
jgi:hypothetical protein